VARFLRGEFGAIDAVDPYLVALIYAGDRRQAATEIHEWLSVGDVVLVDRYVASNIAYQCAKVADPVRRKALRDWIVNLEYAFHSIPRPDSTLFLDVPFGFTRKKLTEAREGDDRGYLRGKSDIHETSLPFQERVREVYLSEAVLDPSLEVVPCADDEGNILSPDAIFGKLKARIKPFL
jgi:dTMP kinase